MPCAPMQRAAGASFLSAALSEIGRCMSFYSEYLQEIAERNAEGLAPKPIDSADLLSEIVAQIKDANHEHRADSLQQLIYNTLPGTTGAAVVKADFLKTVILGENSVAEITPDFAF